MVVSRNGVEFFRLGTAYSTAGGAPADIVFSNAGISSSWIFGNAFAHRSADTDTDFLGAVSAGNSWAKLYMRYEHVAENLHTYTDVDLEQDKRLYFHKETSKNNYISSTNIAAVNHTNFVNEDPNGDLILGQDDLGLCGRTRKLNFLTHVKIVFWIEKMYVSPNSGGVFSAF